MSDFFDAIRRFLLDYLPKQRCLSKNTILSYRQTLNIFVAYMRDEIGIGAAELTFSRVDRDVILNFLTWLEKARGCSVSTRNQRLMALRSFLGFAGQIDCTQTSLYLSACNIPSKEAHGRIVEFLTEPALTALLQQPNPSRQKDQRNLVFMILMYDTAARCSELLDMKVCDLRLDAKHPIAYLHGKGRKTRTVPLLNRTVQHCKQYLNKFHPNKDDYSEAPLFYTVIHGRQQKMSPDNHKARWFAGSALNTAEQAMASVISTVLSRLNAFLDSEMEQILCFDTAIDAEKFCNEKSAIFIVLPEEDQTKYFMVSLILQNLYREILTVADENGGRLKNRVVFFADELGTCPPIQSLELMFSASRSRGLMLVPIVQSITGQLQKNYGKEGSEIIVDNCQVNLYGGFAPASQTAVELSKSLGSRTVMSGSISRGKNDPSQSLQMMERPLMTPDELKSMPKGSFIVAKTGVHPMKVKLRLFLDWGIRFGMPYEVPEKAQRFVAYADKQELEESIIRRHYGTIVMDSEQPQGGGTSAGGMAQGIQAAPDSRKTVFRP